jgi:hypothetical protein
MLDQRFDQHPRGITYVEKVHDLLNSLSYGNYKFEKLSFIVVYGVSCFQYAAREAQIVAQAGRKGAITIATNMAGRGTDIILGGNHEACN